MEQLQIQDKNNFGTVYRLTFGRQAVKIPCYTAKQIRAFYPGKDKPVIVGVYLPSSKHYASCEFCFQYKGMTYSLHPPASCPSLFYQPKGYLPIQGEPASYILLVKRRLWGIFAVFAVLLLAACALFFPRSETPPSPVTDNAAIPWQGQEPSGSGDQLIFDGITSLTLSSKSEHAAVSLHNPKTNQCFCIISLWVQLDGKWQEVYQSGRIDPGKGVVQVTLSRRIPAGAYSAYVKYKNYNLSTQAPMNEVVFHFPLFSE